MSASNRFSLWRGARNRWCASLDPQFCSVRDTALINLNISGAGTNAFQTVSDVAPAGRAVELFERCFDIQIERNTLIAAKGIVSGVAGTRVATAQSREAFQSHSRRPSFRFLAPLSLWPIQPLLRRPPLRIVRASTRFHRCPPVVTGRRNGHRLPSETRRNGYCQHDTTVDFALTSDSVILDRGLPRASMPPRVAAVSLPASDVNQILICENRHPLAPVFRLLVKTEECDILRTNSLVWAREAIKSLQGSELNPRQTLTPFNKGCSSSLPAASSNFAFQGGGIILLTGARVTVAENQIAGLDRIMAFLLTEARVKDNQILALLGLLVLNGLLVRVTGNFIAGILAGWFRRACWWISSPTTTSGSDSPAAVHSPCPLSRSSTEPCLTARWRRRGSLPRVARFSATQFNTMNDTGANLRGFGWLRSPKSTMKSFSPFSLESRPSRAAQRRCHHC